MHVAFASTINITTYVTLEHKTSHKGLFIYIFIDIYTSSESLIHKISIESNLLGQDNIRKKYRDLKIWK